MGIDSENRTEVVLSEGTKDDGALKATSSPAGGIDFGVNIPDTIYMGSNSTGGSISDSVFSAP